MISTRPSRATKTGSWPRWARTKSQTPSSVPAELEALLQTAVGLVGGDDEVLLDRGAGHLPIGALLLVQGSHVRHDEARRLHCLLDGVPDGVAAVVEDHRHPAAGLEDAGVLAEHAASGAGSRPALLLGLVDDRLRLGVRPDAMPGLNEEVEIGVVDVLAEGRVGEDVVDAVVRDAKRGCGPSGDACGASILLAGRLGTGPTSWKRSRDGWPCRPVFQGSHSEIWEARSRHR